MKRTIHLLLPLCLIWSAACQAGGIPDVVEIPAGTFIAGSDAQEREAAYRLDAAAYGHERTREWGWYDDERPTQILTLPAYYITRAPISNSQYHHFVAATGYPAPDVTEQDWQSYGLVHPFARTRRFAWRGHRHPGERANHPVVLVSHHDAQAYAQWLSNQTGARWRLPSEPEWEKAARGTDGRRFPWGNNWDPSKLNSHDRGPFDTMPVGAFPQGASPYGVNDMAGQVFEWTATLADRSNNHYLIKGGSWDDKGCGVCRPAARHGRPAYLKHILIGFRLVRDP
jgi:formylglycine-generating enzyme required for sulfatase activity